MNHYKGLLLELLLERYQNAAMRVSLPAEAQAQPGQYLQIHAAKSREDIVPYSFFPAGIEPAVCENEKVTINLAGSPPEHWKPGTELAVRGPLGRGFRLPKRLRRLALISLNANPGRLLPLVSTALEARVEVTLVSDYEVAGLLLAVESQPLTNLVTVREWADFFIVEASGEKVDDLPNLLGMNEILQKVEGQLLVTEEMPCGGLAKCGICAFRVGGREHLACENGPVFALEKLFS